jgi:hypothetical protein
MKISFVARLPALYYITVSVLISLGRCVPFIFYKVGCRTTNQIVNLGIEAGPIGWQSIEFKELYQTACEYIEQSRVSRVVIEKSAPYLRQVESAIKHHDLTHYVYDPRTGSQDFWRATIEAIGVAILLARYRVVPIVYLTDLSVRRWRCQAAAVSAHHGIVVSFMMPKLVRSIFPHGRLLGPSLMPFSSKLFFDIQKIRDEYVTDKTIGSVVRFIGSIYEPRKTFLENLSGELNKTGIVLDIQGRTPGSPRQPDEHYWLAICSASIIVTTADQAIQAGTDMAWIPHLIYRYLEVLAAGSLLLAPAVPGIARYFSPEVHFVSYSSLNEAAEKIRKCLGSPEHSERVRLAGQARAKQLIMSRSFWLSIDSGLGYNSLN